MCKTLICFLAVVLLLGGCSSKEELVIERNQTENREPDPVQTSVSEQSAMISVYICGAVKNPGVYELKEGSRVHDAVEAAGGFLDGVDERSLNLASVLKDGQQITVLTTEEQKNAPEAFVSDGLRENGAVNINTAGKEQLMTLPGIGEARADAIIFYREEYGDFAEKEDIKNISGIGDKMYERLADMIEV